MYHGTYKSWHYSPLGSDQQQQRKATSSLPGCTIRAAARMAASSRSRWRSMASCTTRPRRIRFGRSTVRPALSFGHSSRKIDKEQAEATPYNPYNRGLAAAYGNLYIGTVDGRLLAVDMKSGKQVWDTKLIDVAKGAKGFTGAPLVVKDKVIVGSNGGELRRMLRPDLRRRRPHRARRPGSSTRSAATNARAASWGNDSWKTGGGGGWMTGTYDANTRTVFWGTANPAPDYDIGQAARRQSVHLRRRRARSRARAC